MSGGRVAYLGWSGRGNIGDDAIYFALRTALPGACFENVPLDPAEILTSVASTRALRLRRARPVIGGGTVIGRRSWRVHLKTALAVARSRPAGMLGCGVEDPVFSGRASGSGNGELAHWRDLLRDFDEVTVRGPRSAELLAGMGVEATVVGDPALMLNPPATEPQDGMVGVNVGFGDDLWGHDPRLVEESVAGAVASLAKSGYRFRFLVANAADLDGTLRCLGSAGLPSGQGELVFPTSVAGFMEAVAGCEVMTGQRLHSVILASACGVPATMLEYQPKCLDFMRSIGREEHSVRTDRLGAGDLAERLRSMHAGRSTHQRQVNKAVTGLRDRLAASAARLNDLVAGDGRAQERLEA